MGGEEEEEEEKIPLDEFDLPLDAVVTPSRVYVKSG